MKEADRLKLERAKRWPTDAEHVLNGAWLANPDERTGVVKSPSTGTAYKLDSKGARRRLMTKKAELELATARARLAVAEAKRPTTKRSLLARLRQRLLGRWLCCLCDRWAGRAMLCPAHSSRMQRCAERAQQLEAAYLASVGRPKPIEEG